MNVSLVECTAGAGSPEPLDHGGRMSHALEGRHHGRRDRTHLRTDEPIIDARDSRAPRGQVLGFTVAAGVRLSHLLVSAATEHGNRREKQSGSDDTP
jgi:hypothetical protein